MSSIFKILKASTVNKMVVFNKQIERGVKFIKYELNSIQELVDFNTGVKSIFKSNALQIERKKDQMFEKGYSENWGITLEHINTETGDSEKDDQDTANKHVVKDQMLPQVTIWVINLLGYYKS